METNQEKFTNYELFVVTIFQNATQKLLAAIELSSTRYSYNEAFFLAIIAQEELAKLIILPIANELDTLENVLTNRQGAFYKHPVKQKIFTNFGLQNRSHQDIEKLKQGYLYVGSSEQGKPEFSIAKPDQVRAEIKHTCLFMVNQFSNIIEEKDFSKLTKKGATYFMEIVKSAISERMSEVDMSIKDDSKEISDLEQTDKERMIMNRLIMNPYQLIRMLKAVFKEDYKEHLSNLGYYSIETFEDYLAKIELD
ncbi:AbiV family abortive infection protein [Muricauda sp. SCSIO 64092]|uniref:AbiV family abortive infection protein n=1 Tax=Allomuricauda sp. SCSIO 64092 TaxID=2908842 RepID=UPI001FF57333|nr:AbiV family abortive infection protein [Muricauda sp. SCSIO 64092]UOY04999.1 AbiV family abortive infection protein [Muricauda sp. SCSIO 64092]